MALIVALLCVLIVADIAEAATYKVGDAGGWAFNVANWPQGKNFAVGDVLVFTYNSAFHNVVTVDSNGYQSCEASSGDPTVQTGNDQITLTKGDHFFICGIPGHCDRGMKISIHVD
ncbi:hypothetical protein QJS04_geneDACA010483 [Acorus gramineus]|uniref:Plantacyanin n=1 Tax=Acorus gramineus TaxID=55184 RepID=A0AAV9AME4_ACOGR|nr:hypothetical protein QJS04_geneDACA010483 [Acorus gramineus]